MASTDFADEEGKNILKKRRIIRNRKSNHGGHGGQLRSQSWTPWNYGGSNCCHSKTGRLQFGLRIRDNPLIRGSMSFFSAFIRVFRCAKQAWQNSQTERSLSHELTVACVAARTCGRATNRMKLRVRERASHNASEPLCKPRYTNPCGQDVGLSEASSLPKANGTGTGGTRRGQGG